ncbi:hypothetical protein [Streptomyces sp. NPDC057052]|uniref:hypothetical protein n=1 Tax=Streptomyces sp. NPDC057052 TaxID=3346010 RepID=UPI0036386EF2
MVPIWPLWFPAASRYDRKPTENDGTALWLVIVAPVVGLHVLLWWAAGSALARRTSLSARNYWPLSGIGTLSPTLALVLLRP